MPSGPELPQSVILERNHVVDAAPVEITYERNMRACSSTTKMRSAAALVWVIPSRSPVPVYSRSRRNPPRPSSHSDQNLAGPLRQTHSRRVTGFQYAPLRLVVQPEGFNGVRSVDALQVSPGQGMAAMAGDGDAATHTNATTIALHTVHLRIITCPYRRRHPVCVTMPFYPNEWRIVDF